MKSSFWKNITVKNFPIYFYKHKKFICVLSVLISSGAIILLEKLKIERFLNKLVDSNLDYIYTKRSDFIYIKYSIYKEFISELQEEQEEKKLLNIFLNPFGKWWKSFKQSIAYKLLNIAKNGNKYERLRAVKGLVNIDNLKDWDFQSLAQICDARTAISLARFNCDNRWFLLLPFCDIKKNPQILSIELHKILKNIKPQPCWSSFLRKNFNIDDMKDEEVDNIYLKKKRNYEENMNLLKEFINLICHLTKTKYICQKIIEQGGLATLLELHKIFTSDNETQITLCKIISNMSLCENHTEDFFVTGWVGVLARWKNHPDVRLQVISAKALANLDLEDTNNFKYPSNIFPLYPRYRTLFKPDLDIVLIHGLLGGAFITWRQKDRHSNELGFYESITQSEEPLIKSRRKKRSNTKKKIEAEAKDHIETFENSFELDNEWEVVFHDCPLNASADSDGQFSIEGDKWTNDEQSNEYTNCWPMEWLPNDYPNIRVIGMDYKSALSEWSVNYKKYCPCEKDQSYIKNRSKEFLDQLAESNVGNKRPVIWIGHSMGGILCKCILSQSVDNNNLKAKNIAQNTKGIMFLGTPHFGSHMANLKQHMQALLSPSIEVKELELRSPFLIELHKRFLNCLKTDLRDAKIVSVAEGSPTILTTLKLPLTIVTIESAKIEKGEFYILKDDHLGLSKPLFRQSFFYQKLRQLIDDIIIKKNGKYES